MLKLGTFVSNAEINESVVNMISEYTEITVHRETEYTEFPSFFHCTEANVISILTEFLETIYCTRSLNDIKNMPDNFLEYQELPPLL